VLSLLLAAMMLWLSIRFIAKYATLRKSYGYGLRPLMVTAIVYSIFFVSGSLRFSSSGFSRLYCSG